MELIETFQKEQLERESKLDKPEMFDDYFGAVQILLDAAKMSGTSGARVASLLLLGLYDGQVWPFDLSGLALLDSHFRPAAITAIRGRFETGIEPQYLINDGDDFFRELWDRWIRYHIRNAWKEQCGTCWGSGLVYDDNGEPAGACKTCGGHGYRDPVEEMVEDLKEIATYSPRKGGFDAINSLKIKAEVALMHQGRSLDING
jgi:hypothetical protein